MERISKITSKGQITLPASWRKHATTDQVLIREKEGTLEITPFYIARIKKNAEYTVFDAIRDNKGKGIKAKDLLKILKKIA